VQTNYKYSPSLDPPGPVVYVELAAPSGTERFLDQFGQLDTGACKCVIPKTLVTQLGLTPVREVRVEGLDGAVVLLPTYLVELAIRGLTPVVLEVLASERESKVLLGRDMLNRYKIILDGPSLMLAIEEP
jgi:predicted aspartyl protease